MLLKKQKTLGLILTIQLLAILLGACSQEVQDLQLENLSPSEYTYIERIITLERAKAVALEDRDLGNVLLDSLKVAWGDSAESETAAMAPSKPKRSKAVHQLLQRILTAENDSLKIAPVARRLNAPMEGYQPALPDTTPEPLTDEEKALKADQDDD